MESANFKDLKCVVISQNKGHNITWGANSKFLNKLSWKLNLEASIIQLPACTQFFLDSE